ncbi:Pimeloyl-ACP methyl ester carboxylesterase [Paenibacillus sp. UNC496MF]|uniref:alpha/beta fold hydrolase n=1 Tax=Paenibacillus sp. UNC496MF TaxID=1502753 RepID=UPI0008E7259A|nr:alpha/beta hydrolase [Paenibacillus sp. UNC496MF]SFJ56010.1 Pimeloyl-ACP methyl ester carboxylesterase [Paenibacillus sp. UNC496MF]
MKEVISKDGTNIAYDKVGNGPALILVDGALCYRDSGPNRPLAALLAQHFTVITYDRRGRGDSGDKKPYSIEREVEDIEALIVEDGGAVFVYGISSGAALALEAAKRIPAIRRVALYEAPFVVDNSRPPVPDGYLLEMNELLSSGRRGAAVKYFMSKGVGVPAIFVAMMQFMPAWSKLKAVAHTLPYDTLLTVEQQKGKPLPASQWSSVTVPVLVVEGSKSPVWMRNAMRALANVLSHAKYRTLEGQTHIVKPAALAPVLTAFFNE